MDKAKGPLSGAGRGSRQERATVNQLRKSDGWRPAAALPVMRVFRSSAILLGASALG